MALLAVIPGMDVLSRDGRVLGTVQAVDVDEFTLLDPVSLADAHVRFELVGLVDQHVHLKIGPSGFHTPSRR